MKWKWLLFCSVTLLCAACAAGSPPAQPESQEQAEMAALARSLPDLGEAPELVGETWLNSEVPLRLADLRGKVVLVDMWTFG
jgi:hypothetical protein